MKDITAVKLSTCSTMKHTVLLFLRIIEIVLLKHTKEPAKKGNLDHMKKKGAVRGSYKNNTIRSAIRY